MVRVLSQYRQDIRQFRQDGFLSIGLLISVLFLFGFIIYPIFQVLSVGFGAETLPLYVEILRQPTTREIITNTLFVGVSVATIGTLIAFVFAFVQVKLDVPFKRFFHLVTIMPMIAPPFVMAMSIITLFVPTRKLDSNHI